jgi:LacI family transcriptional regulator
MADTAIDILLRGIRRKEGDTKVVVDHVMAHHLIKRDSVAAPPPGAKRDG